MDPNSADEFAATEIRPGATRAVIRERDRAPFDRPARREPAIDWWSTRSWNRQIVRASPPGNSIMKKSGENEWRIAGQKRLSGVDNLYRLSLNPNEQFDARNFTLRSPKISI